jgi:hypothetical protein
VRQSQRQDSILAVRVLRMAQAAVRRLAGPARMRTAKDTVV